MLLIVTSLAWSRTALSQIGTEPTSCDTLRRDYVKTILIAQQLKKEVEKRDTIIELYKSDNHVLIEREREARIESAIEKPKKWWYGAFGLVFGLFLGLGL